MSRKDDQYGTKMKSNVNQLPINQMKETKKIQDL